MGAIRFSIDPELARFLAKELDLEVFVETGTYRGESVWAVLPSFEEIHTIELSDELHATAEEAFSGESGVTVHHGRSQEVLRKLAPELRDRRTLFWLDAHWSDEPGAAGEDEPVPLLEEIRAIGSLSEEAIVMIDDARLFLAPPPRPVDPDDWPALGDVVGALSDLSDRHELMVIDDVFVLFPSRVKEALRGFARDHAADWFEELGRARETNARLTQLQAQVDAIPAQLQAQIDAIPAQLQAQVDAVPWQAIPDLLGDLRTGLDRQLESIQRALGEVGEGSSATQKAISELRRLTDERIEALSRRVDGVAEEVRATLDQRLQALDRRLDHVQELGGKLDALERAQSDLGRQLDGIEGRLRRIAEQEGHIDEVQRLVRDQRAHIEELQRLVGILTEAEEGRRNRRGPGAVLLRPFAAVGAVLARPLRRPWNRLKWSVNASREHWRVRRSRLGREPKLGRLQHHPPMPLEIPSRYLNSAPPANPPSISIVTPSFNQGDFLERTIRSVVEQEYPQLEYIVQDGRSTDHTREVLERYSHRIEHWEMEPDDGQAQAINLGFSRATGEVMAYLNSDDLLLPGSLRYVGRFFEAHPEVDVIYGHRVLVDENDMEIGRWILPRHRDSVLDWADFIPQETLFWRRRAWESAGARLDEEFRFALDWDLLLRMRDAGARMVRVPRFLGAFRVHTAQKTSAQLDDAGADEMARIRRRVHNRNVSQEEVDRELRRYLRRHVNLHKLYRVGLIRY